MNVKPGTKQILDGFYQDPYPSMKSLCVMDEDRCLAVTGFYIEDGKVIVFADITPELRERKGFKRIVVKCYRELLKLLKTTKLPVFASACPFTKGSEDLLEHMGFTRYKRNIYQWQR